MLTTWWKTVWEDVMTRPAGTLLVLLLTLGFAPAPAQAQDAAEIEKWFHELRGSSIRRANARAELSGRGIGEPVAPGAAETLKSLKIEFYETAGEGRGLVQYDPTSNRVLVQLGADSPQSRALLDEAAAALLVEHGDIFDFIGFWTTEVQDGRRAGAYHRILHQDIDGIGLGTWDSRPAHGLNSGKLQSYLVMFDLFRGGPSTPLNALAHELGHRWICYLPTLLDGRPLSTGAHWRCDVDGNGGTLQADWVGDGDRLLYYPVPSKDALERDHHKWWRSASL